MHGPRAWPCIPRAPRARHESAMRTRRLLVSTLLFSLSACAPGGATTLDAALASDAAPSPRRATLRLDGFGAPSEGVRLSDGASVAGGDLFLVQSRLVGLAAGAAVTVCEVGVHATLDEVPADFAQCASPPSSGVTFYGGGIGELTPAGSSMLVLTENARYRLRVVSSGGDAGVLTLTLEYAPIW